MRSSRIVALVLVLALACPTSWVWAANTFYVRADGGTPAQCTGQVDAPYPGSGSAQPCAWHHPFDALPPNLDATPPPPPRIAGGDTVIIDSGSYEMGLNAPGATTYSACNPSFSYDCHMQPIPSGPSPSQPTRILGQGWNAGCHAAPELWGSEHSSEVFLMQGSSNVQLSCLEITDHSNCIESHFDPRVACDRNTPPYGNWASFGIYASDSSNVTLTDLNIHGMANRGIINGRLSNWSLTRVHLVANGWAGWDGDLGCGTTGCSSDSGTMTFQSVEVGWNGCAENYPSTAIYACWAQTDNGYGDGLGTAQTGGNWVFMDSFFHNNTSDGLDLLYADGTGSITVERTRSEGNAGNQMKLAGDSVVQNSVIVGSCASFQGIDYMIGNNSLGGATSGDNCRALGNALVLSLGTAPHNTGLHSTVSYNSIISQGDCLILAINGTSASSQVSIQNNVLIGQLDWVRNDGTQSCLFFWDTSSWTNPNSPVPVSFAGNTAWQVKPNTCVSGNTCDTDPMLISESLTDFNPIPDPQSPVIGNATTSAGTVPVDSRDLPRPGPFSPGYDIGSTQYQGLCDDVIFQDGFNLDSSPDVIFEDGFGGPIARPVKPCTSSIIQPIPVIPPQR